MMISRIDDEIFTRIKGKSFKSDCPLPLDDLVYIKVPYVGFDEATHVGELICNVHIAGALIDIFRRLHKARYPIEKIRLVDEYDADDERSMRDNNSSCFNYRRVARKKKLSKHALGLAIDINPLYNPYVTYVDGARNVAPSGAERYVDRGRDFDHKIDCDDLCYKLFSAHGFEWGGEWTGKSDYQHFEVPDSVIKTLYRGEWFGRERTG